MTPGQAALAAHLDAASAMVGLPIATDQHPGVLSFLALAATMAATLDRAPVPANTAPLAPVLRLPEAPPRAGRP
jgi:hypothetical protein